MYLRRLLCAAVFTAAPAAVGAAIVRPPAFETSAPVAYLIDLSSGAELFAKQPDTRILPASMTKMMTAYTAFDLLRSRNARLGQLLPVMPETWQRWSHESSDSTMYLMAGEQVAVQDLLAGVITVSGNDASSVLAEGLLGSQTAYVIRMNDLAARIGMQNSHFGTPTGWPDGGLTYSSARDLALLARRTIEDFPGFYRQFYGRRELAWGKVGKGKDILQTSHNPILGKVDGADGLKTGHTAESGYSFTGSAVRDGRRLVLVVAGLPSEAARAQEAIRLMNWGFDAYAARQIVAAGKRVGSARVQLGGDAAVGLIAPRTVRLSLPAGSDAVPRVTFAYDGPVRAPIRKGDHIADLIVKVPGLPPQMTPLVAEKDVPEAGFFGRALAGFMSFFVG